MVKENTAPVAKHGDADARVPANSNSILSKARAKYRQQASEQHMTIEEYLDLCKKDPGAYASPAERLLKAFGQPEIVDTRNDPRLSRIFSNKPIKRYPAFKEFYGREEQIEEIAKFLRRAADGLEESKQVLYLLGPVGGGKSSIAEKLKELMEKEPLYTLEYIGNDPENPECSPVNENVFGILAGVKQDVSQEYGIPVSDMNAIMSPWARKRLAEADGDFSKFRVVRKYPSILGQIAIAKTEPGDENNQDISALVGKVDIRKLEEFSQDDPDAYRYCGGLCLGNNGMLEFVEMFKAPIKVLHPLLTATQERNYNGTEEIGAIPFNGVILAHSNESEWQTFRNNKNNEAFLDRVYIIKVPYALQVTDEIGIYRKMLKSSKLATAPCAPGTLEMMAQFSVLTRLEDPQNSNVYAKMRVYDGENLKDSEPSAKTYQEYRDAASQNEGMGGMSTRFAFKTLSAVFDHSTTVTSGAREANPVKLLYVLE